MSSKKTTTQNSTNTTTPTNPEWVTNGISGQMGRIDALAASDPYSYVAPASALQNQAFGIAGGLGDQLSDWFGRSAGAAEALGRYAPQSVSSQAIPGASQLSAQAVDPAQAFASLGAADPTNALTRLLSGQPDNPYLASVHQGTVNRSMQGYNDALASAANTLTRSVLPSIRSGGVLAGQYGGSRQGIAEGVALGDVGTQLAQNARNLSQSAMDSGNQLYGAAYEGAQNRMATTADALASLGLQNAQGNAGRDLEAQQGNAANALTAQQFNAQQALQAALANQSAGLQGANLNLDAAQYLGSLGQYGLGALGELGGAQQSLNAASARAPLDLAQLTGQLYGQLPLNLFNGNTQTGNSRTVENSSGLGNALSVIGQLASGIGSLGNLGNLGNLLKGAK